MPSFDEFFATKIGNESVEYEGQSLVRLDYFPFKDGEKFKISFEKKNSSWRQGVLLSLWGHFEIDGEPLKERIVLWEDSAPPEVVISVFQDASKTTKPKRLPQKGIFSIKNVWDSGSGRVDSWMGGAAMIIEKIENGKRYRCNDGLPDENFDDIVFTVQRIV